MGVALDLSDSVAMQDFFQHIVSELDALKEIVQSLAQAIDFPSVLPPEIAGRGFLPRTLNPDP